MNVGRVVSQLKKKYPGKKIIKNDENNPTEVLCEIEPSSEHPEYSTAVSIIDESAPHAHEKTKETYKTPCELGRQRHYNVSIYCNFQVFC